MSGSVRSAFVVAWLVASGALAAPAAAAGSHLTLGGAAHGSVTVLRVVCNSPVAALHHKYFFDIGGTSGGKTFLFSGDLTGYHGPAAYHSFSGLVMADGHYFTGHGAGAGTVTVAAGANSASLSVRLKEPAGAGGATVSVSGRFACTVYSQA